jgi:hypothetical protein
MYLTGEQSRRPLAPITLIGAGFRDCRWPISKSVPSSGLGRDIQQQGKSSVRSVEKTGRTELSS